MDEARTGLQKSVRDLFGGMTRWDEWVYGCGHEDDNSFHLIEEVLDRLVGSNEADFPRV